MGSVEAAMLAYIRRRIAEGARSVPEEEILAAVLPAEHPEFRFRPAYRYGLERLCRRGMIGIVPGSDGLRRYYVGSFPREDPGPDAAQGG